MKYDVKDMESKRTLGYAQNISAARLQASRFTTLARVGVYAHGSDRPMLEYNHGTLKQRPVPATPAPLPVASRSSKKRPAERPIVLATPSLPEKKVTAPKIIVRRAASSSTSPEL